MVDAHRLVVRVIMRKVGADQDQRLRALLGLLRQQDLRQRQAQGAAEAVVLVPHDDGHQLELAERALQKRQLNFQRVLALRRNWRVTALGDFDEGAQSRQLRSEGLVHGNRAEWSRVGVAIINGGEGEILPVGGRNHHHARVFALLQQRVGVGGYGAREWVAGVWANQRHERFLNLRHGDARQEAVNHLGEFFGVGRIKTSGHRGRANLLFSAAAGMLRDRKNQSTESEENQSLDMGILHGIT